MELFMIMLEHCKRSHSMHTIFIQIRPPPPIYIIHYEVVPARPIY